MSKFIGKSTDCYGNVIYVIGFNEDEVEFNTDLRKAILLSDNEKKAVGKVLKKQHKPNIKYIKLEKFEDISATTLSIVRDYKHDFLTDIANFASKKDNMNLECIDFAKNRIEEVTTFEEFGNTVASILIEKYGLQKRNNNHCSFFIF